MVEIDNITSNYDLVSEEAIKGNGSRFVLLKETDNARPLELTLHYVQDNIYSVIFLNNEFYEIPQQNLIEAIKAVLSGSYDVKKSFFRRQKSISINAKSGKIIPERVTDSGPFEEQYHVLPRPFKKVTPTQ